MHNNPEFALRWKVGKNHAQFRILENAAHIAFLTKITFSKFDNRQERANPVNGSFLDRSENGKKITKHVQYLCKATCIWRQIKWGASLGDRPTSFLREKV